MITRRQFSGALGAATLGLNTSTSTAGPDADAYPVRPIELIVGYGPGGVSDLLMRAIAQPLAQILGQPVVISNKPGAGGTLGPAAMAARDKPDGYTLAFTPLAVGLQPIMRKTTWDPLKDFTYISMLMDFTIGIAVPADSPFKTLADLLAYAKANPGGVSYAALGPGSGMHVGMERVAQQAGVKFTYVPFSRPADVLQALMGGSVMSIVDAAYWAPYVDSGKMRLLALGTDSRSRKWPTAPTLKELGYNFTIGGPAGLSGPAGMQPAVVKKLDDAIEKCLKEPSVVDAYERYDMRVSYLNSANYRKFMEERIRIEGAVLKAIGFAKP